MAFVGGPHQRRGSAQGFLRVHVGAVVEQHLHRLDVAGARRHHQRRPAERQLLVRDRRRRSISAAMIAASPFTLASHSGVAPSRFAALAFAPARISRSDHLLVAAVHRPVQRRRAVGLRRIHVGVLRHQRAHGRLVAAHGRVGDVGRAPAPTARHRQQPTQRPRCTSMVPRIALMFMISIAHRIYRFSSRPVLSPMLSW